MASLVYRVGFRYGLVSESVVISPAICGSLPFIGYCVCLVVFGNGIGHNGRLEATDVLNHQHRFATVVNEIVFEVVAEIGWWKVNFYANFREAALNEFDGRYKVAVSTDKSHNIGRIHYAVLDHTDRDVYVGFLFFWSRNIPIAVRAYDMLVKILASYNLEPVAIDKLISIKESTLSAVFLRAEW